MKAIKELRSIAAKFDTGNRVLEASIEEWIKRYIHTMSVAIDVSDLALRSGRSADDLLRFEKEAMRHRLVETLIEKEIGEWVRYSEWEGHHHVRYTVALVKL